MTSYQCDVETKEGEIITVFFKASNLDYAKARVWEYGDPVNDPEEITDA